MLISKTIQGTYLILGMDLPRENCIKLTSEACYRIQLQPVTHYLDLSLDVSGTVCYQFGLHSTVSILYRFSQDFPPGLLVPALPQLEHLCQWQTTDW